MKINVAGTWRPSVPSVNVAGVWRPVKVGSVNVAGVWRPFYQQNSAPIPPGVKLSATLTVEYVNGSGIDYFGYITGGAALSPNVMTTGARIASLQLGSDGNSYFWTGGNTVSYNVSIRIDDKPAIAMTNGQYDAKFDWTSYTINWPAGFTRAEAYSYFASKYNVATVAFNVD